MALIPINLDGRFGLIRDVAGHLLDVSAWTHVQNARMQDQVAGAIPGHQEQFAGSPIAPHKLFYVPGESALFWVSAGLTDVVAHDGSSYSEITRTLKVPFNSGSTEPTTADVLTGATSGASGTLVSLTLDSGTWAGGDAAGTLELEDYSGTFNAAEDINNTTTAATNVASTNGAATEGDYTGTSADRWNGGVLSGILVLNNNKEDPQYWATADSGTRLADLPNWPANTTAKVVRPFKSFLVALDITTSGVRRPYLVKWSHPADPGSVPSTWDASDATKDAGEFDLGQTEDFLVDQLPLSSDVNIIYKENTTWGMQYTQPPFMFRFWQIFGNQGMFSQQCAAEFKAGQHAVLTRGDFIVHNGQSYESIINARNRKWLFNAIDPDNWDLTIVGHNPLFNEVWICFPSIGSSYCDRALIWNYKDNTYSERELPNITDMQPGVVSPASDDTWDSGSSDSWDAGEQVPWDSTQSDPTRYRTLMASPGDTKLYLADETYKFDGTAFTTVLERAGLAVESIKFPNSLTINTESWKTLRGVRPRFKVLASGATVDVWVGIQEHINAEIVWKGPFPIDALSEYKVDVLETGRLFGVRFQSQDHFEMDGYDLDIERVSLY